MRLYLKAFAIFLISIITFITILLLYYQNNIFYPHKKELNKYHYYWLNRLKEDKFELSYHKNNSYLIIRATKESLKNRRFKLLRDSLKRRGVNIEKINSKIAILLHGKNGRKEDLLAMVEKFMAIGFTIILPDLPAHGDNKENYIFNFNRDSFVDSVLNDAKKYINIDKSIAIWGFSLGGAYAISSVAKSKYKFGAIAVVSTFDNLYNVVDDKSRLIFGDRVGGFISKLFIKVCKIFDGINLKDIDIVKYAKKIEVPTLIIHGKKDKIINYHRGEALYNSFYTKNKTIILDDSDHYSILKNGGLLFNSGVFLMAKLK